MDEANVTTPDETVEVEPTADEPKGMRKVIADQAATIKRQRTLLLEGAYDQLGLQTDSGLGKAIAKEYDGEPTYEALAAYAKEEYGYEGQGAPSQHPDAPAIQQGQAALDNVSGEAGSVPLAPTKNEELSQAERERDNAKTMRMKSEQVASWFGQGSNP